MIGCKGQENAFIYTVDITKSQKQLRPGYIMKLPW